MTSLRDAALAAYHDREKKRKEALEERQRADRKKAEEHAAQRLEQVLRSRLGTIFPGVAWTFVEHRGSCDVIHDPETALWFIVEDETCSPRRVWTAKRSGTGTWTSDHHIETAADVGEVICNMERPKGEAAGVTL